MKSSAIILALIMLLLVLVAAFVFLFQGRSTLMAQRSDLHTAVSDLQSELDANSLALQVAEGTRTAVEAELATAVADGVLLEGQLVESQQQVDSLSQERDDLLVQMESIENPETVVQLPTVEIIAPQRETAVAAGDSLEIVFAASDPQGITAVSLLINGDTFQSYSPEDMMLFTATELWEVSESGDVEIGVLAVNSQGLSTEVSTTVNVILVPEAAADPAGLSPIDPNQTLRTDIENNVVQIRGLEPKDGVTTTILTREQLIARVETDLLAEYTEAEAQNDYLTFLAFDMVPAGFDLYNFTRDLYGEQIAGFYDPETNEFVVVSDDDELDITEQLTHAHEYMHALQDQHFTLDSLDDNGRNDDASTAFLALIEGEAVLLQTIYLLEGYVDINELFASLENEPETPILDSAPPVLANSLLFPYLTGQQFTQTLYDLDGFAALDEAWANIPQSTEQIIHPERYLAGDSPQLVTLPPLTDTLGTDWTLVDENVFGEFMVREYLSQQLNEEQVDTAVTGWGGDRYAVYANENEEITMVLHLVWDTDEDATEFAALYPNYPAALFDTESQLQGNSGECWQGPDDVICLFQNGRYTTIIRTPDIEMATAVLTEINSP